MATGYYSQNPKPVPVFSPALLSLIVFSLGPNSRERGPTELQRQSNVNGVGLNVAKKWVVEGERPWPINEELRLLLLIDFRDFLFQSSLFLLFSSWKVQS